MKTVKRMTMLYLLLTAMIYIVPQKTTAQVSVSFQLFYDNLSAHGYWINDPNYGYVWSPNVAYGFTPYCTNGYWVYTDYGWTWASNYSWGWAPFHYGRWYFDSYYGWLWVPDTVWGPGWVTWRQADGFYGWTAISPGISIEVAYSSSYNVPYNHWTFVRDRDFGKRAGNYYIDRSKNATIFKNSTIVNNIRTSNSVRGKYNAGPNRLDVSKHNGNAVGQVALKERDKPGQLVNKGEMQLYRPNVERDHNGDKDLRPSKVRNQSDVKPFEDRKAEFEAREKRQAVERTQKAQQPRERAQVRERAEVQRNSYPNRQPQPNQRTYEPQARPREMQPSNDHQMSRPERMPSHNEHGNGKGGK